MDRIDHHATDRQSRCPASHLNGPIEKRLAIYLEDSITICCHGGIVENLLAVMGQAEVHRWPGEACELHDMTDMGEFGRGRFEKFLSGRLIEKEIGDFDPGARHGGGVHNRAACSCDQGEL